jgi:hypothetical protein
MKRPGLPAIYLAGSIGGVETARPARGSDEGTGFGAPPASLCSEIESDREKLGTVMEKVDVTRSRVRPAIGWLGERLGRLKPHGQSRGYSRPGRVVELELLVLGVSGKRRLRLVPAEWVGGHTRADFAALASRAEDQRARVTELQLPAVRLL